MVAFTVRHALTTLFIHTASRCFTRRGVLHAALKGAPAQAKAFAPFLAYRGIYWGYNMLDF
jgi:hypothetical protein